VFKGLSRIQGSHAISMRAPSGRNEDRHGEENNHGALRRSGIIIAVAQA